MNRTMFVGSYTEPGSVAAAGQERADPRERPAAVNAVLIGDDGLLGSVRAHSQPARAADSMDPVPIGAGGPDGADGSVRNASFLAVDGPFVYAVEELADGAVVALNRDDLSIRSRVGSGGSDPCHLTVAAGGNLVVANYGSGTVTVVPAAGGELAAPVPLAGKPGSGPVQDRQEGPHAHQVTVTDSGTVLVCDLGTDRIDEYGGASDGRLVLQSSVQLPAGTGPRHLVLIPGGLLVVGELDARLHHIGRFGSSWQWLGATPIVDPFHPSLSSTGGVYPSHLALSADGALLYVAIRGRDSLSVLDISGLDVSGSANWGTDVSGSANWGTDMSGRAGSTGEGLSAGADASGGAAWNGGVAPRLLAEVPCGGRWPRHFVLSGQPAAEDAEPSAGGWLYVANERSHQISVFALGADGVPEPVPRQQFVISAPACLVIG